MAQEAPSAPRRIDRGVELALPPWAVFALTFTAYLLMARLGLLLAIQPSNASPLFPAAGVGLAGQRHGGCRGVDSRDEWRTGQA